MKKLLIIIVILLCSFSATAQDYKTHKVKEGETIEEIAKQYLVTPFDIFALNPDAKKELKPDMVLIIPTSRVKNEDIAAETRELIGYKTHKTRRKETLFSISKKYGIEVEDIKKYNTTLSSIRAANNLKTIIGFCKFNRDFRSCHRIIRCSERDRAGKHFC